MAPTFQRGAGRLVREDKGADQMKHAEQFTPSTSRAWDKKIKKILNKRDRRAGKKEAKEQ